MRGLTSKQRIRRPLYPDGMENQYSQRKGSISRSQSMYLEVHNFKDFSAPRMARHIPCFTSPSPGVRPPPLPRGAVSGGEFTAVAVPLPPPTLSLRTRLTGTAKTHSAFYNTAWCGLSRCGAALRDALERITNAEVSAGRQLATTITGCVWHREAG